MTAAVLIPAGGQMTAVDVATDDAEAMAKIIGCSWIDIVRTTVDGLHLAVDDEGRLTGREPNLRASVRVGRLIVGDALLIAVDLDGTTIDVPQHVIDVLVPA
jgi:hypothetical protein